MPEAGPPSSLPPTPSTENTPTLPPPPNMADLMQRTSRPLSEISENESRRRSSARQSLHSVRGEKASRPNSEVRDDNATKRLSGHIATITLNLNDYAAAVKRPASALSTRSRDSLISPSAVAGPSVSKIPAKPERPASFRTTSVSSIKEIQREQDDMNELGKRASVDLEQETKEGHPLLMAKRASLRPSPLGATYAEVAKSEPPTPSTAYQPDPLAAESSVSLVSDTQTSTDSAKPLPKTKPSWLRRASGTAGLRTKSKSPVPSEETLSASASLPPELPPRRGGPAGLLDRASRPPDHPSKASYANIAAASSSRSRLGDGAGRPAVSPTFPAQVPRDNLNIRSRIAAWTSASQTSQPLQSQPSSISRSDSSNTIASTASNAFSSAQQRLPSSAQRMIGSAGSAVQKGWAGLRARGMGGSISGLSSIASGGSGEGRRESLEPPKFNRKASRDRSVSAQATMGSAPDGPVLHASATVRPSTGIGGKVFGRDVTEAGKAWSVADRDIEGLSEWERKRREYLPAVVVRAVDYLEVWGPKEEGIFRISGRSSHINRLKREFDSGADLDMADCHPGDLDPHAVSGIFKSYLRDLPCPLLTKELSPRFEAAVRKPNDNDEEDVADLLPQLPIAHWFLLADIIKLLELIPQHTATNRMTLNALMLSLGPSLNIPGTVLTELLARRTELFETPPPISGTQAANDLIDFGDTAVAMPSIEDISRSASPIPREASLTVPVNDKPKRSPLLSSKPSLSRLLNAAHPSLSRKNTASSAESIAQPSPPRVEVRTDSERLPSFENDDDRKEEIKEKDLPPRPASSELAQPAPHYPSGAVEERIRLLSTPTPIADMFAGSTSSLAPLRSNGSTSSLPLGPSLGLGAPLSSEQAPQSAPTNPASVIRRGPPIFFQSASVERPHGRSTSANSTAGTKRKDETAEAESGDGAVEEARAKRLSAGPGSLSARESIRGMEMLA